MGGWNVLAAGMLHRQQNPQAPVGNSDPELDALDEWHDELVAETLSERQLPHPGLAVYPVDGRGAGGRVVAPPCNVYALRSGCPCSACSAHRSTLR